ncbi:PIN domain-containing protein [Candidatus Gottesmanbacteria bacterium]|nr:PIN domain-containing protein [Candidatus Gottesmanbacteria bacterium]
MKVFLDTNIFIRFFVPEDEIVHASVRSLLDQVQQGVLIPYTSSVVLLECSYVLQKNYGFPSVRVQDALDRIVAMRNMTIKETTNIKKALSFWRKTAVKFTDCLIATQVPDGVTFVTYDRDFAKLPVRAKTPKQILAS